MDGMIVPFVHDTPEWHALRAGVVGASETAALFDAQAPYQLSRYALWHVKAKTAPAPEVNNPRVKWGILLEAAIAEAAGIEFDWDVRKGGFATHPSYPGLGASLDYEIAAPAPEDAEAGCVGPGALEIKNVDWLVHKRSWEGEPPLHVELQLQAQLAATGYSWGAVVCLVGGNDLRQYRFKARPKIQAEIGRRVREFWQSIQDGREPPPDGSDSAAAIVRALHPELRDEQVDLTSDNELPELCMNLLAAAQTRKEAEKIEAAAKTAIFAKLGDCRRGKAQGYWLNVAVVPDKPERPALPGEMIPGRLSRRRLNVKEM